jgi:hypothetical protein
VARRRRHNPDDEEERRVDEIMDLLGAGPAHPKHGRSAVAKAARRRRRRQRFDYAGTIEVFSALCDFVDWFVRSRGVDPWQLMMEVSRITSDDTAPDPLSIELEDGISGAQSSFWATTVPITEQRYGKQWRSHGAMGQLLVPLWTSSNKHLSVYDKDPQHSMRFNPYLEVDVADIRRPSYWWIAAKDFLDWLFSQGKVLSGTRGPTGSFGWVQVEEIGGTRDTDPHERFQFLSDSDVDSWRTLEAFVYMLEYKGRWPGKDYFWHRDGTADDFWTPQTHPHLDWPMPEYSSRNGHYHFFIDEDPWASIGI